MMRNPAEVLATRRRSQPHGTRFAEDFPDDDGESIMNNNEPKARPDGAKTGDAQEGDAATAVFDDLEKLRTRAQERDQFLDLLKRTQADFENYQKRNKREWEQERRYLHGDFAKGLLPVIDNLARATAAAEKAGEKGPLVQGVGMVQNQLLDLLRRQGVTPINPVGQP